MGRRRWIGRKPEKPVRKRRRGMRPDQLELAASARQSGLQWHEIAALFREQYNVEPPR